MSATDKPSPQRICFIRRVRRDRLDEYRASHAAVWPEMREALRRCGWRNYSLFLREDGLLVGYLECNDFTASQACMDETEVNTRWQSEMAPFFEPEAGRDNEAPMTPVPEVFHLD